MKALDCGGGIDDRDIRVSRLEIEQFAIPIVAIDFMNYAVEGALLE